MSQACSGADAPDGAPGVARTWLITAIGRFVVLVGGLARVEEGLTAYARG